MRKRMSCAKYNTIILWGLIFIVISMVTVVSLSGTIMRQIYDTPLLLTRTVEDITREQTLLRDIWEKMPYVDFDNESGISERGGEEVNALIREVKEGKINLFRIYLHHQNYCEQNYGGFYAESLIYVCCQAVSVLEERTKDRFFSRAFKTREMSGVSRLCLFKELLKDENRERREKLFYSDFKGCNVLDKVEEWLIYYKSLEVEPGTHGVELYYYTQLLMRYALLYVCDKIKEEGVRITVDTLESYPYIKRVMCEYGRMEYCIVPEITVKDTHIFVETYEDKEVNWFAYLLGNKYGKAFIMGII